MNMEKRIDYQQKVCDLCSAAMTDIVTMMKKRKIKVLKLSGNNSFAHFSDCDGFPQEEPILAVCVSFDNDMLFYTTDFNIMIELGGYDEDIYNENGDYDFDKLYNFDEVWSSFYDGPLTDVLDVYDEVYEILKSYE